MNNIIEEKINVLMKLSLSKINRYVGLHMWQKNTHKKIENKYDFYIILTQNFYSMHDNVLLNIINNRLTDGKLKTTDDITKLNNNQKDVIYYLIRVEAEENLLMNDLTIDKINNVIGSLYINSINIKKYDDFLLIQKNEESDLFDKNKANYIKRLYNYKFSVDMDIIKLTKYNNIAVYLLIMKNVKTKENKQMEFINIPLNMVKTTIYEKSK